MKAPLFILTAFLLFFSCKKNTDSTPAPAPVVPTLTGVSPSQAIPGASITISGTNLQSISGVRINGTDAFYKIQSSAAIIAEVPSTASSGLISIVYTGGTQNLKDSFFVLPAPDLSAPVISNVAPNNNPVSWPVLITGTNISNVKSIYFDTIKAPIDTNFAGTVTTRVPAGVRSGLIKLTITNNNGVSASVPFTILSTIPDNIAPPPIRVLFGKPSRYVIHIKADWFNETNNTEDIGIFGDVTGTETINNTPYNFTYALDTVARKITLKILRGQDPTNKNIYETYSGQFIESQTGNQQRIVFTTEQGRQVSVVTGL